MTHPKGSDKEPTIRDLYPDLTEEERKEAEETLDRYIAFALRVYEELRQDPERYAQFKALTRRAGDP